MTGPDFFNPTGSDSNAEGENQSNGTETKPPVSEKLDTGSDFFTGSSNDDLKSWLNEQAETPKQAYNHEAPKPEAPKEDPPAAPAGDNKPITVSRQSEAAGKMVAKTIDYGWSVGAKYLTESESRKPWAADEEDMDELISAWALYIESEGAKIPPWLGLVLLNLVIYIFKIPDIIKARKEMLQRKAEEKKAEEEKIARRRAAFIAEEHQTSTGQQPSGSSEGNAGQRVYTSKDNEPITNCLECNKPLSPVQIERGGSFCCTAHANKYRARREKERQKTIILNQNS